MYIIVSGIIVFGIKRKTNLLEKESQIEIVIQ